MPKIFLQFDCGYSRKVLFTNCSFHMGNIWSLVFRMDLTWFGLYFETAVQIFCRMGSLINAW